MNELSRPLEIIETEIHFYKQQTATGIIEIGKRLIEAKTQLQHGEWGKWLKDKVDFTHQTAVKFMRISEEYSNLKPALNLGSEKLWIMLDVPSEEREQFIQDNNVQEMSKRELQEAIKARKYAEGQAMALDDALDKVMKERNLLERNLDILKNKPPEIIEKEVVKQVIPNDYEALKNKAQKLEESLYKANQEINNSKNEIKAYKEALDTKRVEGSDILNPKNFAIDVNNFLRKISPLLYYTEQFLEMTNKEKDVFYEQIEKLEIACNDVRRAIDGEKGGANTIIINKF